MLTGTRKRRLSRAWLALLLLLAATANATAQDALLERVVDVDIGSQPLATALIEFSKQAQVQVIAPTALVEPRVTLGVRGRMTMREALTELMRGTALSFRAAGRNAIGIGSAQPASVSSAPSPGATGSSARPAFAVLAASEPPDPNATATTRAPAEIETIPVPASEERPPPTSTSTASDATRLDEITVTASKRLKRQRDLPATITAFKGEDLEKINAQGIKDYLKNVPGVTLTEKDQDRTVIIIRGIATATNFSFTQGTVGLYMDEIPLGDPFIPFSLPDANPFDLERVEVLKGPQSTLFGAGALSGAVRYITRKPDFEVWEGKLQTSYASNPQGEPRKVAAAALNVPLFSEAALRISGTYSDIGGMVDTRGEIIDPVTGESRETFDRGDDVNRSGQRSGRLTGQWNITDGLTANVLGFLQKSAADDIVISDNDRTWESRNAPFAQPVRTSFGGGGLTLNWDIGDYGALTSTTSFLRKRTALETQPLGSTGVETFTGTDGEPGNDLGYEDQNLYSQASFNNSRGSGLAQEFRFTSPEGHGSPWDWLLGLAYSHSTQHTHNLIPTSYPLDQAREGQPDPCQSPACPVPTPLGPVTGRNEYQANDVYFDVDQGVEAALFGELTRRLFNEHLEVVAGGRWFLNDLKVRLRQYGVNSAAVTRRIETIDDKRYRESGFNPKVSLRWIFNPGIQTYLLAAKGFQFGGVQVNPPFTGANELASGAFIPYKSSSLWNYEWGWRTDFFDRRLRLDWTAFLMDWKDLQFADIAPLPSPFAQPPGSSLPILPAPIGNLQRNRQGLFSVITNIGHAQSRGVEAGLTVLPLPGLAFSSSVAWVQAQLAADFTTLDGVMHRKGTYLPGAARFQISNVLNYSLPSAILGGWEPGISLIHAHIGESFSSLNNSLTAGGYDTLNVQANLLKTGWAFEPNFSFALNNITDVRGVSQASGDDNQRDRRFFLVAPRTVVLALSLNF